MGVMPKPAAPKYRTRNWTECNAALKRRGSAEVWFDREMDWLSMPRGRAGRPRRFSASAIELCLTLKVLFSLPLRQATGLEATLVIPSLDITVALSEVYANAKFVPAPIRARTPRRD